MAAITLLRHGQASFGADNYDQLSELGHQQAYWLGQHLRRLDESYDRVLAGTMVRHDQTAQGVLSGLGEAIPVHYHAGLNEYDFQGLLTPLKAQHPEQWLETGHAKRDYYHNMKLALAYWMDGTITSDGTDSWPEFCARIQAAFAAACQDDAKRTLIVSSGGPVAVILQSVLQLGETKTRDLILQIKNSSTSKLLYNRVDLTLDSFNDISHLLTPDKKHGITFS
ncbi:hypothetical protein SIN8267_02574 [Sinobacterium norvegicum]|uniref:Histidine phosphatase family protein n=1 Tax=Sinobacterium norvegicum TaxID=1641715 RepID=A0ABM9AGW4_9GAMM|nr:histidine phosphatase family protein [Sinobacterium norvegicum]CAH0992452.1 hypothetical protein SIN8267_02574 [Sinobacterium norvegicum]